MIIQKKLITWGVVLSVVAAVAVGVRFYCFSGPFVYAGTLETTKVILSSKIASDIVAMPVAEGDTVVRGQVLVEMSCDVYKVLAKQIDNDYARAEALVAKGHMSRAEFDVLERNKRDNDLKLEWCRVTSPIDGIVMTKFRENGEVVGAGTTLLSVANPYDIWAYFYVPHDELYRLHIGDQVQGFLPEMAAHPFTGTIIKINEEAEFTPKNVQTRAERTRLVYGVKVRFDNPDLILKSGMTIESALFHE